MIRMEISVLFEIKTAKQENILLILVLRTDWSPPSRDTLSFKKTTVSMNGTAVIINITVCTDSNRSEIICL